MRDVGKEKRRGGKKTHPAAAKGVQIRATDTAVRDLDIDIGLFPGLRLEFLPDHVALAGAGVETHPSFELVFCLSHFE